MEFTEVAPAASAPLLPPSEPAKVDVPKETAVEPPKADTALAPDKTPEDKQKEVKLAQMIKAKKAQIMRERQIKAERAALLREKQEIESFKQAQANAKLDPDGYLKAAGLTYDELVQYYLSGKKVTPEMQIDALKQDLERKEQERVYREKVSQERQARAAQVQAQEVITDFKSKIAEFVKSKPDDYELVNIEGDVAVEDIFDRIEESWRRTGKVMTIEQAANIAEEFIEGRVSGEYLKAKKLQKHFQKPTDASKPKEEPSYRPKAPTLTNEATASSAAASYLPPATEADRMRRAMDKLG